MTRDRGELPPCKTCPKIPKGDEPFPHNAQELSDKNWKAYQHWRECRAVGNFPDDAIVRRNAAIIQAIHDEHREHTYVKPIHDLIALIPIMAAKRG